MGLEHAPVALHHAPEGLELALVLARAVAGERSTSLHLLAVPVLRLDLGDDTDVVVPMLARAEHQRTAHLWLEGCTCHVVLLLYAQPIHRPGQVWGRYFDADPPHTERVLPGDARAQGHDAAISEHLDDRVRGHRVVLLRGVGELRALDRGDTLLLDPEGAPRARLLRDLRGLAGGLDDRDGLAGLRGLRGLAGGGDCACEELAAVEVELRLLVASGQKLRLDRESTAHHDLAVRVEPGLRALCAGDGEMLGSHCRLLFLVLI